MVVQSRRYFDLRGAAATSRRLLEPRTERAAAPERPVAPADTAAPSRDAEALAPFERGDVDYKVELWDALLEWTRRCMDVVGCYALDERGFMVASAGELGEVPPEVFLSAFAATSDTLTAYSGGSALRSAVFEIGQATRVTLLPVAISGGEVLLGLVGAKVPTTAQAEEIRNTVVSELELFESSGASPV